MKLYFTPGACSLHPQIALREAGESPELVRVDSRSHKTKDGIDFFGINPKGYVPVLELDDGTRITEGVAIDQYIADTHPDAKLAPAPGTMARVRLVEWLNFLATEIHKAFGPLFVVGGDQRVKEAARDRIGKRLDFVARELGDRPFFLGDAFTVADAYLYNLLRWTRFTGIDLSRWPALVAFFARVDQRPSVQAALSAERA
jgi:glutathione S-transferase